MVVKVCVLGGFRMRRKPTTGDCSLISLVDSFFVRRLEGRVEGKEGYGTMIPTMTTTITPIIPKLRVTRNRWVAIMECNGMFCWNKNHLMKWKIKCDEMKKKNRRKKFLFFFWKIVVTEQIYLFIFFKHVRILLSVFLFFFFFFKLYFTF